MPKVYFENVHTGERFEVLKLDAAAGKITLKGKYSPNGFVEDYDKEKFKKLGYKLVREPEAEEHEDA